MTTVTEVTHTCDLCGSTKDVTTRAFALDGKAYEIDLCRKDGAALGRVTARYIAKARKVTAKRGQRQHGGRPRSRAASAAGHRQRRDKGDASKPATGAKGVRQQKGIYVYGILPADIDVAGDIPGVGEHPGPLRDVRLDGLAALISEVDLSGQLGSPDDLRTYREILDATATEVPVLPLRFGTVLANEDAVAGGLLAANHDEFTAALNQLEGRVEFQVKGRYVRDAVLGEVLSGNKRAARLRDAIGGQDPDAARDARIELDQLISEAVAASREEDTRALRHAMEGVAVASVALDPAHDLDSVHVAFLVAVDAEREVERVVEDLTRDWEGRIDVQLLGPMAAYDFTGPARPESS